ncbi:Two component transcriptional regulator, LytTR family [Flavobacterium sp. 9AF]|uniref:LytR/AlgR family response regulator transcription factor n=1 Tax=Flavobacterium sp. 9AF TaxID=2653142 RepID=UPI0012EFE535|nr:LytTR family DNA-binding domain-containing protein [Flavobacterium sp. 9AF]VXB92333.1 Two component transcriptional regulator, LytTR family [Flavobacterium sp. 9AF]
MTKLLKCIIVDDEPPSIRLLEKYILKIPFLELVTTFTKPLEALQFIEINDIDLVLLDIQMPEISGIQLSKIIKDKTKIIFTTAYSQFALESYDLNAVDYLLKPIAFERFYHAISKLNTSETIKKQASVENANEYVFFKTDGKNKFSKVFVKDIKYIEGLKNYVTIHLENEKIITYSTLKNVFELLSKNEFIQIHKSYIIALKHINKIDNDSVWINKKELSIGNTYRKFFFEKISNNQF